jgi:hypothetical protein
VEERVIGIELAPIMPDDLRQLFDWRNDPDIYARTR